MTLVDFASWQDGNHVETDDGAVSTALIESVIATRRPWTGEKYISLPSFLAKREQTRDMNDTAALTHVMGVEFHHTSDTQANNPIIQAKDATGNNHWELRLDERRLRLYDSNGILRGSSSPIFVKNTWYRLEVSWKRAGAGTGYVHVHVDGSSRIVDTSSGDYNGSISETTHLYEFLNASEGQSLKFVHFYRKHGETTTGFLGEWNGTRPYGSTEADFFNHPSSEVLPLENALESPRDGVAKHELLTGAGRYVGCSTHQGPSAGPRNDPAVNGATAVGAKWMWQIDATAIQVPFGLYGNVDVGSETSNSWAVTPTTLSINFITFLVSENATHFPTVTQWGQLGSHSGNGRIQPFQNDLHVWMGMTVLVTGGVEPTSGKRASAGTLQKTPKEVIAA